MSVLQINDNDIIDPQTMTWDLYDLDSEDGAGRNQSGEMFRERVAVKRKVNCTWAPLEPYEMAELLQAMDDSPNSHSTHTPEQICRPHRMFLMRDKSSGVLQKSPECAIMKKTF